MKNRIELMYLLAKKLESKWRKDKILPKYFDMPSPMLYNDLRPGEISTPNHGVSPHPFDGITYANRFRKGYAFRYFDSSGYGYAGPEIEFGTVIKELLAELEEDIKTEIMVSVLGGSE